MSSAKRSAPRSCRRPKRDWARSLDQAGAERPNGQVCEITERLDLSGWPTGSQGHRPPRARAPRRSADASATATGYRFQAILTDQTATDIAALERDHRARARVEDHIRNDKDTGLRNLPFRDFEHNRVWLALVGLAHDLIVWTQRLLLSGELAKAEPKRLRYRLLHIAARLAFHARSARLRLPASWPWAADLAAAFAASKRCPTGLTRTRPATTTKHHRRATGAPPRHARNHRQDAHETRGIVAHEHPSTAMRTSPTARHRNHVRAIGSDDSCAIRPKHDELEQFSVDRKAQTLETGA